MSKYLKEAQTMAETKNVLTEEEMMLPMDEFVQCIFVKCGSEKYGTSFQNKIVNESNGLIRPSSHKEETGDCYFYDRTTSQTKYAEVKISFLGKNRRYRIANIREYQKFDYFIFCFVDVKSRRPSTNKENNDFKPRFYVVPKEVITKNKYLTFTYMNGSKESNVDNRNSSIATTINYLDLDYVLSEDNLLESTSYSSFKKFIQMTCGLKPTTQLTHQPIKKRERATKIRFLVTSNIPNNSFVTMIDENTNEATLLKLVTMIGPENLYGYYHMSLLNKLPSKYRKIELPGGYWFSQKASLRDVHKLIKSINKHVNLKIQLV